MCSTLPWTLEYLPFFAEHGLITAELTSEATVEPGVGWHHDQ